MKENKEIRKGESKFFIFGVNVCFVQGWITWCLSKCAITQCFICKHSMLLNTQMSYLITTVLKLGEDHALRTYKQLF